MTTKPVHFDIHAVLELGKLNRGLGLHVTRDDVRTVLRVGERRFNQRRYDGTVRWSKTAEYVEANEKYQLEVIYTEDGARILVITVYMVGYFD